MENKNFKQAEETFSKSVEDSMKWFSESAKAITETYNKQLELSAHLYKKFMDASMGASAETNFKPLMELLQKRVELFQGSIEKNSALFKELVKTSVENFNKSAKENFSSEKTEVIMETYRKQLELLAEVNEKYFDALSKQMKEAKMNIDFKTLSEKFRKSMNESMDVSQNAIENILKEYNKQADSSAEANKKLLNEINTLVDFTTKIRVAFWNEILEAMHRVKKEETKHNGTQDRKKQTAKSL